MIDDGASELFIGRRFLFALPSFDESINSFSRLLAPVIRDLRRLGASVVILSSNSAYKGEFADLHVALARPKFPIAFLDYMSMVIASTLWIKRHGDARTIVHNVGVGATLVQDLMTAHACHAAWIARKRVYGQGWTALLNPLHAIVLTVEWLNYRRKPKTIAVSREVAQQIATFHHGESTIIPNGLSELPARSESSRAARPIKAGTMTIAFASNDHQKKGLGELLAALELAAKAGRSWRLSIFGADAREDRWRRKIARLGLSDRVTFCGHVQDLANRLAQSDVLCLPSYYESFGLVYLEAALVGTPIVGSHGVYPELIGDDMPPLPLRDPMDPKAIYEALALIQDDEAYRRRLVERAALRAKEYTEEKMVTATRLVYSELIKTKVRAGL